MLLPQSKERAKVESVTRADVAPAAAAAKHGVSRPLVWATQHTWKAEII